MTNKLMTISWILSLALVGAGGHDANDDFLERMAAEHAGDAPVASPAAMTEVDRAIETSEVTYATGGGEPVTGFLAKPEGAEGAPAMIVIHEWWGLNENVESMARQLAGEGFVALAVDLYGGRSATTPDEARELASGVRGAPERFGPPISSQSQGT